MSSSQTSIPGVPPTVRWGCGTNAASGAVKGNPLCWAELSSFLQALHCRESKHLPGAAAQPGQGPPATLGVHCPLTQTSRCTEVSPEHWKVQLGVSLQPRFPTPTAIWILRKIRQTFLQYPWEIHVSYTLSQIGNQEGTEYNHLSRGSRKHFKKRQYHPLRHEYGLQRAIKIM